MACHNYNKKEYSPCINRVLSFSSSPLKTLFLPPPRLLNVICTTLISVMGPLVLSLHICLSLFTQCPCPGRIPWSGPRCRPGAAESPNRRLSESATHPNWNMKSSSLLIRNFYLPLPGSALFTFQREPCHYLLKQNPSLSVGIPRSIYPFS